MRLLYRTILIFVFLAVFSAIVAYARGYRFDLGKKTVIPTGIISVSSSPKAAKIYVNGNLKGATDSNITLPPGNYKIEVKKEGYTGYQKEITLKGELVSTIDATLFPTNSSLSPLTNLGIIKAITVGETEKIIIFVDKKISEAENEEKNGVYLFEGGAKAVPFFPPLKTIVLKNNLPEGVDMEKATVTVSPDIKEAIFEFEVKDTIQAYLLSLETENTVPFDVTQSKQELIEAWNKRKQANILKILETFPQDFYKIASNSVTVLGFSPNETKVLYRSDAGFILDPIVTPPLISANQTIEQRTIEANRFYVYDKKEDKNFQITLGNESNLEKENIAWYFDSRHLIINQGKKIAVIDYDNTNMQTIYSGPYQKDFFSVTTDGKIIVLSNLNPEANLYPDLYLVGIR